MTGLFDRLDGLLHLYLIRAHLLHSRTWRGTYNVRRESGKGQFFLVWGGSSTVMRQGSGGLPVDEHSLIISTRSSVDNIVSNVVGDMHLAGGSLDFEGDLPNPIIDALPEIVCSPLSGIVGAASTLQLLSEVAPDSVARREALAVYLFNVFLTQLLRNLIDTKQIDSGLLSRLATPKLRKAIVSMREKPGLDWSLDMLAQTAGMSRTAFISSFRETVGYTPESDYRLADKREIRVYWEPNKRWHTRSCEKTGSTLVIWIFPVRSALMLPSWKACSVNDAYEIALRKRRLPEVWLSTEVLA
ncbi:AraC family transcriptional regulator [Paraburkholderia bengalensis]|uniref:AraC family transcriptional regulator n=1 Tax=Paraburkholderia bengalensis TaxID=2747562 RepID=A0ABU8J2S0_9BURK